MRLRHAVLLTSSKSSHLTQLPSRQHIVRITSLDATLMCFPVNVANKRLTVGLSSLDATLTRIGGRGPQLSSEAVSPSWHSPFPLPPIPFFFIVLRTLLHNGTGATLFQSISYALFSSRRRVYPRVYPSHRILDLATRRQLSHCTSNALFFLTSLPPYFVPSRRASRASCYTVPPMVRQRLGQHFLADLHWREEIARAIRVSPHSTVPLPRDDQQCWIEIGSGHGEMTQHLLAAGAPVHAIEIDPAFLAGLRHLAKQFPNLTVVPGDILKADLAAIASGRRMRIYGNLSVVTQFYTRPEFVFEIPRDAFEPPPEVASALVTLRLPGERAKLAFGSSASSAAGAPADSSLDDASRFLDFVKLCFSQKRKTLVNNLRSLAKPDHVREALATLKLRPDSRAEQLPVAQLAALRSLLSGS